MWLGKMKIHFLILDQQAREPSVGFSVTGGGGESFLCFKYRHEKGDEMRDNSAAAAAL
jgi:hypothetical protein